MENTPNLNKKNPNQKILFSINKFLIFLYFNVPSFKLKHIIRILNDYKYM